MLNLVIALRVVVRCARLYDINSLKQLLTHVRLEFGTLVRVDIVRNTKMQYEFIEKYAHDRKRLLIWQCVSFYVLCEIVEISKNVSVTKLRERQKVYNVYCDAYKCCSSADRSESTTVARVSLMLIACLTVIAPVLDLFENF